MNLSNIKPASGSTHNSKRLGRGQGSGKGGTSSKIKIGKFYKNRF